MTGFALMAPAAAPTNPTAPPMPAGDNMVPIYDMPAEPGDMPAFGPKIPYPGDAPASDTRDTLPEFKPQWWYSRNWIDIRPVIWSLENRPEEWRMSSSGRWIEHVPSHHTFMPALLFGWYLIQSRDCTCTSLGTRRLQFGHQILLGCAVRRYRRAQEARNSEVIAKQFPAHFIRPKS